MAVESLSSIPGAALRRARLAQGLSLRALSTKVGLPYSTLSKLENGKMAMTYDKLICLSVGLGVDIEEFVAPAGQQPHLAPVGRRSVARAGAGPEAQSGRHNHIYPAADLLGKSMVPIIIEVKARSVEELGGLIRHAGEEFLFIRTSTRRFDSGQATRSISTAAWPMPTSKRAPKNAPCCRSVRDRGSANWPRRRRDRSVNNWLVECFTI